jgi:hypothetical protein
MQPEAAGYYLFPRNARFGQINRPNPVTCLEFKSNSYV